MKAILFFLALIAALILEGIGIRNGREIAFWIVIILPIAAFFSFERGKIPRNIIIAYLVFLIISAVSTAFSSNMLLSLRFLALYTACGFAFLFTVNNKQIFQRTLLPMILILSVFFSLYSIFVINFVEQSSFLMPNSGYQWVFPLHNAHLHLGDLLLLPLIICLHYLLTKNLSKKLTIRCLLLTLLLLPFFLFAYSRSAYVSFIITAFYMVFCFIKQKSGAKLVPILVVLAASILCIIFFITMMFGRFEISIFGKFYTNLISNHKLSDNRLLLGARDRYAEHAILSTIQHPLLGVGPGNYIVASNKYVEKSWLWTETSHNIFLDILSENGIATFFVFIYVFYLIFRRTDRSLYFFMALALFLDFQTDYTYRMYSMFLLFVILLGLSYKNEGKPEVAKP